jgi:hypothetical protein
VVDVTRETGLGSRVLERLTEQDLLDGLPGGLHAA